ncbi:division/outer membrane stress-associated lipid-binding lipoprotein [Candidatus Blochmanniella camponoti]|uniref:Division/outer membrane stress-associated lipid-binding lipoprotein n=1 Tax=Candidatus Blochmanniella camponoti TaxID=108080 RepID=A0AAE9ICY3_9ENTR|nr:division/outer membrane stress-associated lipid-binding lipoprotein [Candidatus Blochmannia herculeanus]URJ26895.1 division/outer membrane stress-associated lipid-binding lipoprotein [Candidatus Blochmannia herculeanus]URJ27302.1 division/outer membrane stress-associated lipid-binding lipoprotein [Candidatus Blochmannia herculeanus]
MNISCHISQILLILFSILALQACCSGMLTIGTAAFITTAWNDPRTIGTQLDDNILENHIAHALKKNKHIKQSTRIKNTVYQGNVLLTGQTPSMSFAEEAIKIVMKINGTKNIYNAIRQDKPICIQSILTDTWISTQIRLNFFIKSDIHASNIKIITENKEVFLLGQVTHEESKCAEKTAHAIAGVKNVFTAFSYTS